MHLNVTGQVNFSEFEQCLLPSAIIGWQIDKVASIASPSGHLPPPLLTPVEEAFCINRNLVSLIFCAHRHPRTRGCATRTPLDSQTRGFTSPPSSTPSIREPASPPSPHPSATLYCAEGGQEESLALLNLMIEPLEWLAMYFWGYSEVLQCERGRDGGGGGGVPAGPKRTLQVTPSTLRVRPDISHHDTRGASC